MENDIRFRYINSKARVCGLLSWDLLVLPEARSVFGGGLSIIPSPIFRIDFVQNIGLMSLKIFFGVHTLSKTVGRRGASSATLCICFEPGGAISLQTPYQCSHHNGGTKWPFSLWVKAFETAPHQIPGHGTQTGPQHYVKNTDNAPPGS